ncbi:hypothetical protein D3C85_391570 [compost metagenome]
MKVLSRRFERTEVDCYYDRPHQKNNITTEIEQMKQKELTELTDQELLQEAKKMKSTSITNAALIGFLIGIVFYSIMKNSLGFFTLIPLFFAYKLINNSKYKNEELENLLKERNLK